MVVGSNKHLTWTHTIMVCVHCATVTYFNSYLQVNLTCHFVKRKQVTQVNVRCGKQILTLNISEWHQSAMTSTSDINSVGGVHTIFFFYFEC